MRNKFKVVIVVLSFLLILFLIIKLLDTFISKNISISEPIGYYLLVPIVNNNIKRNNKYLICITNSKYLNVLSKLGLPNYNEYGANNHYSKYSQSYNNNHQNLQNFQTHSCISGFPYLIKQVAAIPGDTVRVTNSGVIINNHLQSNSKSFVTGRGVNLYPLPVGYSVVLKPDEYFVLGITPHSIDSRYFGVIKRDQFYKQAILIFKEKLS